VLRFYVFLGACALAVAGVGCGSGSSQSRASLSPSGLDQAIARTRQVHSAHVVETLTLGSPAGGEQGTVTADVDFTRDVGNTLVDLGSVQEHAVFERGTVWLSMTAPQFKQALPTGKKWVQSTESELESLGAFHPLKDSLAMLDGLRGVQTLTRTGPDRANFRFSLTQALARTPPSGRAALQNAVHATGSGQRETGSVALTPAGTVSSETLRIDGTGAQSGLHLRISLALSGIGETVTPTPPPSGQVVALSSVPSLVSEFRSSADAS
jgi:hypothetical protein